MCMCVFVFEKETRGLEKVEIKNKKVEKGKKQESWRRSRGELQIFTVRFSEWVKVPPAAGDAF